MKPMKIEVIEGNEKIVVVVPTASIESQTAKRFLRSIELNVPFPTLVFVESSGDEFHFSKSINEGIRQGFLFEPDYVLLSNDDVYAKSPNWIYRLIDNFGQTPEIGYVVPHLVRTDGSNADPLIHMPSYWNAYFILLVNKLLPSKIRRAIAGVREIYHEQHQSEFFVNSQPISLIDVKALKKIGYFDEKFHNGCDDFDFTIRFLLNGYKVIMDMNVVAMDVGSATGNPGWANALNGTPLNVKRATDNWRYLLLKTGYLNFKRLKYMCNRQNIIINHPEIPAEKM